MATQLVNLKDGNNYLVPKTILSIDTSNLLASSFGSYTATQDCYIVSTGDSSDTITIDGAHIWSCYEVRVGAPPFLLKAGQSFVASKRTYYYAYGIKY